MIFSRRVCLYTILHILSLNYIYDVVDFKNTILYVIHWLRIVFIKLIHWLKIVHALYSLFELYLEVIRNTIAWIHSFMSLLLVKIV
jgi:hypothetical protein